MFLPKCHRTSFAPIQDHKQIYKYDFLNNSYILDIQNLTILKTVVFCNIFHICNCSWNH
jgi:hypothetical protein